MDQTEPWDLGLRDTICPACEVTTLQPAGLFRWCAGCGLTIGSQEEELLSDRLIRIALFENRGGALA